LQITEENFIEQMKKRNEKSLEYVIDNYAWVIKTVLKKHLFYLIDYYDECMNDCLLAIWENIYYYNPEKSNFKNWIGGIARFKAIDYTRKYLKDLENIHIEDINISIEDNSYKKVLEREVIEEIENLLQHLSKEDQIIFKKIYFEEKDMNEVSSDMGLSKSILYNRISRGKKKIRDEVKKEGGYRNGGIKKYL
jgi:RNA polymerase sigma-70 factor (ECF subfamily)